MDNREKALKRKKGTLQRRPFGMCYLLAEYVTLEEVEKVFEEVKTNMRRSPHHVRTDRLDSRNSTILLTDMRCS